MLASEYDPSQIAFLSQGQINAAAAAFRKKITEEQWVVQKPYPWDKTSGSGGLIPEPLKDEMVKGFSAILDDICYALKNQKEIVDSHRHYIDKYQGGEPRVPDEHRYTYEPRDSWGVLAHSAAAIHLTDKLLVSPELAGYSDDRRAGIVQQLVGSVIRATLNEAMLSGIIPDTVSGLGVVPRKVVNSYLDIELHMRRREALQRGTHAIGGR